MNYTHSLVTERILPVLLTCIMGWFAVLPVPANAQEVEENESSFNDLSAPEKMLDYLAHHRRDVALVSYSVKADGSPDTNDPIVSHNANLPMPLASTQKIVLLAAFAREVSVGRLNSNEPVTLADWERNYLPATDGGAHAMALSSLGIAMDEFGFARNPNATVTLDQLVFAMMQFSDNAAPDWLLERIGQEAVSETIARGGLIDQEPLLSPIGLFLSWNNHEDGPLTERRIRHLARMSAEEYAAEVQRLHDAFQNSTWRLSEFQWRLQNGDSQSRLLERLAEDELAVRGTASDYGRIMGGVITGTFISTEVSLIMRRYLEWPMQLQNIADLFIAFGNKGGSFGGGVLTDASYYVPRRGDFTGKPRVSVLFMHRVPLDVFDRLTQPGPSYGMGALFELRMILERGFNETVSRTLNRPWSKK